MNVEYFSILHFFFYFNGLIFLIIKLNGGNFMSINEYWLLIENSTSEFRATFKKNYKKCNLTSQIEVFNFEAH